jgi:glycosyltransferase involved in cell wall biosynthesis
MTRIIATCPTGMVGVNSVLSHGQGIGLWKYVPLETSLPEADLTILGGFHPLYPHLLSKISGKKAILWCSSLGEIWLEPTEESFLKQIEHSSNIDLIIFGDPEIADVLEVKNGIHLPYPVDLQRFEGKDSAQREHICMFGPATRKKNSLNQLAAVKLLQKIQRVRLCLNTPELAMLANFLGIDFDYCPWLPQAQYYDFLAKMRVSLQVSYAESFGYSSLEAALLGVVPVTSSTIRWNLDRLTVANPNSPREIAEKVRLALGYDIKPLQQSIHHMAEENNTVLKRWISTLS